MSRAKRHKHQPQVRTIAPDPAPGLLRDDAASLAKLARDGDVEFINPAYVAPPKVADVVPPAGWRYADGRCTATYDLDSGWGALTGLDCDQKAPHPGLIHHSPAGFWWGRCDLDHEHPEAV